MYELPLGLNKKLIARVKEKSLRSLKLHMQGIDFYSNDYLGFSQNKNIQDKIALSSLNHKISNGSTGSRLISGTHPLHLEVEKQLAHFHNAESALLYNSGYDANIGLFSSVLQKGDVVLYDEYIHASVRDGINLSNAKKYKFRHNDVFDLEKKIIRFKQSSEQLYIAVETIYSMDGDRCPLEQIVMLCKKHKVHVIVDEAHSGGVFGEQGKGVVCELGLEQLVFARVHTFGKALGAHGAVVLGSNQLKEYLINFSRSFIYTTAIPLHTVLTIKYSFLELLETDAIELLKTKIAYFNSKIVELNLSNSFITSQSAIHCCVIAGNSEVKRVATAIQKKGILVKAVISPTVPKGKERIRFCLHAFNTLEEIDLVLQTLVKNVKK